MADGAATSGAAADLPLADGVVLLQGLRVDFTGAAVPVAAAAPAAALRAAAARRLPEDAAAVEDDVLAAAEADIAAELSDHGASAETVLEYPGEGFELDGTPPEPDGSGPEPEAKPEPAEQVRPAVMTTSGNRR